MKFEVTYSGTLAATGPADEAFDLEAAMDTALDLTMEELVALPTVEDPAMNGTLSTGAVEVTITVDAPALDEAVAVAGSAIRAALHAAGVITGWDDMDSLLQVNWHKVEADDLIDA